MQRTTHKTLALFALLLFALTTVGSAQSSKTFESSQKSYSIKVPASYNYYESEGQNTTGVFDNITIVDRTKSKQIVIKIIGAKSSTLTHATPKEILDKGTQGVISESRKGNRDITFQKKFSKITTSNGPIYLREGTLGPPANDPSFPQCTNYFGYLRHNQHIYLFTIIYPKSKKHLRTEVFQILKTFTLK